MRVIFNQYFEPLFVVYENVYQQMLARNEVNKDQVLVKQPHTKCWLNNLTVSYLTIKLSSAVKTNCTFSFILLIGIKY